MKTKSLLITGSVFMALAVAFGAFSAHVVKEMLVPERFEVYQTAVQYHFYHSIGLLILGVASFHLPDSTALRWSGALLVTGILLFSGSLYILTLTDTGWLGMITPFGGLAFIGGWVAFGIAVLRYHQ